MYSEPMEIAVIKNIFTDVNKTAVATDVIAVIRASIIDIILFTSTADQTVIAPITNQMLLFRHFGTPLKRFLIRSPYHVDCSIECCPCQQCH